MINLDEELKTVTGEKLKDKNNPLCLKDVLINALMYPDNDITGNGVEMVRRGLLAQDIYTGKSTFTSEEIVLLKELVAKVFTTTIVFPVWSILDGNSNSRAT